MFVTLCFSEAMLRQWEDASFRERDGLVTRTDRVVAPTAIDTRPLRERKEGEGGKLVNRKRFWANKQRARARGRATRILCYCVTLGRKGIFWGNHLYQSRLGLIASTGQTMSQKREREWASCGLIIWQTINYDRRPNPYAAGTLIVQ